MLLLEEGLLSFTIILNQMLILPDGHFADGQMQTQTRKLIKHSRELFLQVDFLLLQIALVILKSLIILKPIKI